MTVTLILSSAWPEGPSRTDFLMLSSHWGFIRLNACTLLSHLHGSMTQQEQLLATSPAPYCSFLMQELPAMPALLQVRFIHPLHPP